MFVSLDFVVRTIPISIRYTERVIGVGRIVRIDLDRLPVSLFGLAILLQIIICQANIEIRLSGRTDVDRFLRSLESFRVPAQLFITETCLGPGFGVGVIGFRCLLKIRQSFFAVIFREKTQAIAEKLNGPGAFVAARGGNQFAQRHSFRGC